VTAIDDRADTLADHLHNASMAAAQLADARDQTQAQAPSGEHLAAGQCTAADSDAHSPAAQSRQAAIATTATAGQQ
jgi:hypothetical protein